MGRKGLRGFTEGREDGSRGEGRREKRTREGRRRVEEGEEE
jgi:hypothetical protein